MTRGTARYFEDVELGDEIGPQERDITTDAVIAFCRLWGTPMPNRFTDKKAAEAVQLTDPIVPGIMGMGMMAQLFTDWSPNGTLKHLDVVFRQPVPHASVVISGVVTDKREEGGENLVDCDVYLSNGASGRLIGGKAIISLPSRPALS